jgi:HTH-type transcriptional regulator/antitoxin HipB
VARVAKRIAQRRRDAGMTQEDLADSLNTAVRNVQRMESGAQNLTLGTLARIAKALGVEPEDLIGPVGSPGRRPNKARR